ncbi:MAG TPA: SDR family NAD(P)-dependent oxidoreductase [Candidatus Angelobacter sp.]|nr:SDR family NAD(P)-dependent oxidoreductase [Candidatus Angelobacter sp.]
MDKLFNGKIALVTGSGRGIGAAIAGKLGELGATVVVCGRTLARLQHTAGQIRSAGGQAEPIACDVADWHSVAALAERMKSFGRLDILVNNAGVGVQNGPLHTLPPEKWDTVLNTNLRGVFYMIRAFAPVMISSGGGDIVNISSLAGKNPLPNGAAYSASKWGLNGLSYSVAEELRGHNIRVSVICPGSTHTEFSPHEGKSTDSMLAPEDIAHAVAMLVTSRKQAFISEINIRPTRKS